MRAERVYARFGVGGLSVLFDDGEYRRLATPRMIYVKASKADAKGLDDITDTPEGRCTLDSINERIAAGDGSLTIQFKDRDAGSERTPRGASCDEFRATSEPGVPAVRTVP